MFKLTMTASTAIPTSNSKSEKRNNKLERINKSKRKYRLIMGACYAGYFLSLGTILYFGCQDPERFRYVSPESKRKLFKSIVNLMRGKSMFGQ